MSTSRPTASTDTTGAVAPIRPTGADRSPGSETARRIPLSSVTIHGHDVGYRRAGRGETVVLLHGLAGSSRTWSRVMPELAEHHDVIAPDLMGHGESAKPMGDYSLGAMASGLRDLLAVLDVERATIVGQSFGGGVAMQTAYQHPDLCDRLVLVGSGGLGREVSWMLRALALPGAEQLLPFICPTFLAHRGDDVSRFLHRRGLRLPLVSEMWRSYSSLAGAENRKAFVRTMRGVIEPGGQSVSALDRLYLAAHIPTLVVWGDEDRIIPVEHAHTAHEAIPGSRLEILDGVGHFPHAEAPERFLEVILDFMATTQPQPVGTITLRDALAARADAS